MYLLIPKEEDYFSRINRLAMESAKDNINGFVSCVKAFKKTTEQTKLFRAVAELTLAKINAEEYQGKVFK